MSINGSIGLDQAYPTLSGVALQIGATSGSVTLTPPTLAGALNGPLQIGPLTASGTMLSGSLDTGRATLVTMQAAGAALAGNAGTGAVTLAPPTLSADEGAGGRAVLQPLTLRGVLQRGAVVTGSAQLKPPTLAASMVSQGIGAGAMALAPLVLAGGSANSAGVARASISLRPPTMSAQGVSGSIGTATISLPLMALDATGAPRVVGSGSITLPVLRLGGAMRQPVPLSPVSFTGIALNTRTKAVSNYAGLAPNSMARFNGVTLLATPDGIMALAGDTDGASASTIDAHITTGKTNFGVPDVKRVLTGYVGLRASGDMELTLIADDHHEYSYTMPVRRINELHQTRTKFGRGVEGAYWQLKVSNTGGCEFFLDRCELRPSDVGAGVT